MWKRDFTVLTEFYDRVGTVRALIVTDATLEEQRDKKSRRPIVARFEVSQLHEERDQSDRAWALAEMLNKEVSA